MMLSAMMPFYPVAPNAAEPRRRRSSSTTAQVEASASTMSTLLARIDG